MLLLDMSAWSRVSRGAAPENRLADVARLYAAGELATSAPFLLELGFSARTGDDRAATFAEIRPLPHLAIDAEVESLALDAQSDLTRTGHHRLPPPDLLIAALAHRHDGGVLHYDKDFDLLREQTRLRFDSVWLAPRGTL